MASLSSSLCLLQALIIVYFLLALSHVVQSSSSSVQLTVSPRSGVSPENIEIRCELTPSTVGSSLTTSKVENVFLLVKTDNVKPSGILLMFDDSTDQCEINRERYVHIDVCNATLIQVRLNHTVLNETLDKIDYSCRKGNAQAISSFRILRDQSARYYDPLYNFSSTSFTGCSFLLFFVLFWIFVSL